MRLRFLNLGDMRKCYKAGEKFLSLIVYISGLKNLIVLT